MKIPHNPRGIFPRNGAIFRITPVFLVLLALGSCAEKAPVISSLDPRIGIRGDILSIHGKNFGPRRNESYVILAGAAPTSSSYLNWQDDLITLRVPDFGDSGLVYVHVEGKKSNGALFSSAAAIPRLVQHPETGSGPQIFSVEPKAGAVGSAVRINGSGFGASREQGAVYFAWDAESTSAAPAEAQTPSSVEVSEPDFGYVSWSDREINVRIPDGAISGNLEVRTPAGKTRPFYFEISGKPGTKIFRDKRSYTISYSVDIKTGEAESPNTLYLWVPQPAASASQRNIELLSRNVEPLMENFRGTGVFQFHNLPPGSGKSVSLSYKVEVYGQETSVKLQSVRDGGDDPLKEAQIQATSLIPADNQRIRAQAAALAGGERNPYTRARNIYDWIITGVDIQTGPLNGGALEALDRKRADPCMAALLFCALARAADIPSLPVAGVLVDRNRRTSRHYWAEFWIDGFGWIPLDPALGAGAAPDDFNLRQDAAAWYFGNLDNQRITFSRGQTILSRMDPRGRTAAHPRGYAFQNLWEEAAGGLESYSSLWGDVTITGMYVQ
jgi:transglutaminase-like putative cysteine protease